MCLALTALLVALGATPALAATGDLTQKPFPQGCFVQRDGETGAATNCVPARFPGGPREVQISPDGKHAYTVTGGGLAIFDRDSTGALTQKAGTAGCISGDGSAGQCAVGRLGESAIALSPDGKNVYTAGGGSRGVFTHTRDPATGELTQSAGPAACTTATGSPGPDGVNTCAVGRGLQGSFVEVTVSPDGKNVYVASTAGSAAAVAVFDRSATTGELTQKPGTAGCTSADGSPSGDPAVNACVDGNAITRARSVAISLDGRSVYVASDRSGGGAVAIFDRDPATGELTQKPGSAGCISQTGDPGCTDGKGLTGARSVTISPDGGNVYVAAYGSTSGGVPNGAVAILDRDKATGELAQKGGTAGCVTPTGSPSGTPPVNYCGAANDALLRAQWVRVSPNGENVYVSYDDRDFGMAVAWLDRDLATGALTYAGCVSDGGSGGKCATGSWGGSFTGHLAVSPDNRNIYQVGFTTGIGGFLLSFDRERGPIAPGTPPQTPGPSPPSESPGANSPSSSPSPPGADTTAPGVSGFGLTNTRFAVGAARTPISAAATGTRFKFTLSEPARVRLAIARRAAGRRRGSRCVAPTRRLRNAKPCVRIIPAGTLTRTSKEGANRVAFSGRIESRALKPGRYQASLTATDNARNTSKPRTVGFRIVKR